MSGFSQKLLWLARISPPGYGKLIAERNLALLRTLNEFMAERPPGGFEAVRRRRLPYGCPHCRYDSLMRWFLCSDCLWRVVMGRAVRGRHSCLCCHARFPSGSSYFTVRHATVRVIYAENYAELVVEAGKVDRRAVERVRRFLQDHIDWGNLPCWGESYKAPEGAGKEGDDGRVRDVRGDEGRPAPEEQTPEDGREASAGSDHGGEDPGLAGAGLPGGGDPPDGGRDGGAAGA